MKDILSDSGLFGYVDGTLTRPILDDDGGNAAAVEAWALKDAKALTAIRTRISQTMMAYVIAAESANEAWTSLRTVFDVQGPITITMERRKFARYTIPEGSDIEEHIRVLRTSKEKLALLGEPLGERDFNLNLLTALPESWDSFIASIDLSTLADNSSTLIGRILQEDARRRARSGPSTAFPATQPRTPHYPPRGNSGNGPPRFQNQSRNFQSNGNRNQRHPSHPNGGNFSNNRPPRGSFRRPQTSRDSRPPGNTRPPANEQVTYTFMANNNIYTPADDVPLRHVKKWIGDTGSQCHIVSDRSLFHEYTLTPGRVIAGVGAAPVLGVGKIFLHFEVQGHKTGLFELTDVLHVPTISHHLISLGRLTTGTGLAYYGIDDTIEILDPKRNKTICQGVKFNNLYEFKVVPIIPMESFLDMLAEPGTTGMSR